MCAVVHMHTQTHTQHFWNTHHWLGMFYAEKNLCQHGSLDNLLSSYGQSKRTNTESVQLPYLHCKASSMWPSPLNINIFFPITIIHNNG